MSSHAWSQSRLLHRYSGERFAPSTMAGSSHERLDQFPVRTHLSVASVWPTRVNHHTRPTTSGSRQKNKKKKERQKKNKNKCNSRNEGTKTASKRMMN